MKLLAKKILSYLPTNLPVGLAEFEVYADSILELVGSGLENVPKDDMKFIVASIIMHLGPQRSTIAKNHFVRSLRKGAANQVASQVFQDVKIRQKEAAEAAQKNQVDTQPVTPTDAATTKV